MAQDSIQQLIDTLELAPHPEGGYFKETIRGAYDETLKRESYSSIYFLLTHDNISHYHRIDADEIWYFHTGQTLALHLIDPEGHYDTVTLGPNVEAGDVLQYVVRKGTLFASSVEQPEQYALVGCMCQPAFQFETFEMIARETLEHDFPHLTNQALQYALTEAEIESSQS